MSWLSGTQGNSDARLCQKLIEDLTEPLIAVRTDQSIVFANAAAERVFGYPPDSLVGQNLDVLLPEKARGHHQENIKAFGFGEEGRRSMSERGRLEAVRRDGSHFPVKVTIGRIDQAEESLFYAVVSDASSDEEKERALQRETRLSQALSQFLELFGERAPGPERLFADACRILAGLIHRRPQTQVWREAISLYNQRCPSQ